MSANSDIEWTDATWSPTVGCQKVSAGCEHCYAINTAYRLEHAFGQPPYQGTTRKLPDGSLNWTGQVRMLPERLELPLRWRTPRRIFVDSMSDLFHDDVTDGFIVRCFETMRRASWHTFQLLTKRPERMAAFVPAYYSREIASFPGQTPLPNVWLGVSVENQAAADERIPLLLQTPAAVRFLSCEPLLGPVELSDISGWTNPARWLGRKNLGPDAIAWVIAGGESGPSHRPMDLDWARSLRDQCQAAGVAFHFKQVGGRTHATGGRLLDGRTWDDFPQSVAELVHA